MRRQRTVWIVSEPRRLLVKGWRVGDLLMEAGYRPIWLGNLKAWTIDNRTGRLADLVAYLEYRNVAVTVTERGEAA